MYFETKQHNAVLLLGFVLRRTQCTINGSACWREISNLWSNERVLRADANTTAKR